MANTHFIKTTVEPAVLELLAQAFGQPFTKQFLNVGLRKDGSPRLHEFDAVSADKSIVAGIRSSSGLTSGGRRPAGKIAGAFKEAYFLTLAEANRKLLVVTDAEYYNILSQEFDGLLPPQIEIMLVEAPAHLRDCLEALKGRTD